MPKKGFAILTCCFGLMDQGRLDNGTLLLQKAKYTSAFCLSGWLHHCYRKLVVVQTTTHCLQGALLRIQPTALPSRKKWAQSSS